MTASSDLQDQCPPPSLAAAGAVLPMGLPKGVEAAGCA